MVSYIYYTTYTHVYLYICIHKNHMYIYIHVYIYICMCVFAVIICNNSVQRASQCCSVPYHALLQCALPQRAGRAEAWRAVRAMPCHVLLCLAVLCRAVLCRVATCHAKTCRAVPDLNVPDSGVPCSARFENALRVLPWLHPACICSCAYIYMCRSDLCLAVHIRRLGPNAAGA